MLAIILYTKTTGQSNEPLEFECPTLSLDNACEHVFREFNHVNGDEEISRRGLERRSMSKGDIVHFHEHKAWMLGMDAGWKEVTADFAQTWLKCVEFKDAMMGLDWCLANKPELAELD